MPERVVQESQRATSTTELVGPAGSVPVAVVLRGDVPGDARGYALQRIGDVAQQVAEPLLFVRIKLTQAPDPARERPAIVEVAFDVDGELVRARVEAHAMREAIDLLQARLRDRLTHRRRHRRELRRRPASSPAGEWRHGDPPTPRPNHFDRPDDERQIVRHKTFETADLTVDEAAFDLEQLDHGFHLFREAATGDDALLERLDGGRYRLQRRLGSDADPGPTAVPVEMTPVAAPELSVPAAIERLDDGAEPFVFFSEPASGRGAVVYRRYDGHYGLLTFE